MPITAKDAIRLNGRSDQVSDEARLDVFEFLAQSFVQRHTFSDNNLLFPLPPRFPNLSVENSGVRLFSLPPCWLF